MNVKQVIVVRKDLNMNVGKVAAQVAHASMKVFFDRMASNASIYDKDDVHEYDCRFTPAMTFWMNNSFAKIVVGVNTLDELTMVMNKALDMGYPVAPIVDSSLEQMTCVAIGPEVSEHIDTITGHLPLLRELKGKVKDE